MSTEPRPLGDPMRRVTYLADSHRPWLKGTTLINAQDLPKWGSMPEINRDTTVGFIITKCHEAAHAANTEIGRLMKEARDAV